MGSEMCIRDSPMVMEARLPAESLVRGLDAMAWPAQALKVGIIIGTSMCLGFDMVDGLRLNRTPTSQTVLAEMLISIQNASPAYVPLATIPSVMSAFALLMLLPAFITMLFTVARAMSRCACAAALPACSWG